jgi:hypothetical protein
LTAGYSRRFTVIMPLMRRVLQLPDGHCCGAPSYLQGVPGGEPQTFVRSPCDTH